MNELRRMWYDGNGTLYVGGDGVAKVLRGKLSKAEMDANAKRLCDGWNAAPSASATLPASTQQEEGR